MSEEFKKKQEGLIAKIKALLAKTIQNGATEQEALAAAAKAAELMEKYDIEISDEVDIEDEVIAREYDIPVELHDHLMSISMAICELCEVEVIGLVNNLKIRNQYRIYGFSVDVQIAEYLHELIINAVLNEYKKASGGWFLYKKRKREIAQFSFLDGLSERLAERIRDLAWARQHKKTGNALVVVKDTHIKEAMKDLDLYNMRQRKRDIDMNALRAGADAANRINLNPAVETSDDYNNEKLNTNNSQEENETTKTKEDYKKNVFMKNTVRRRKNPFQ